MEGLLPNITYIIINGSPPLTLDICTFLGEFWNNELSIQKVGS